MKGWSWLTQASTGFTRRDSVSRGGGMVPAWVRETLPAPRAEADPLELVRAIECDDC